MTSVEKNITEKLSKGGEETTSKLKRRRGCIVDVNEDIRTPFSLLDGQILCEIFARLPVKSLLQVKRVCKHWHSVVRDPYFVGQHCTRSKACPKLLICVGRGTGTFLFSVDLLAGGVLVDQVKLEIQSEHQPIQILNPINGLVCFMKWTDKVLIYNPSTGDKTSWIEPRVLEEEKRRYPIYGFGFDSKTKEHKVVCLWQANDFRHKIGVNDVCEVLTVGKNTWRKIDDLPPYKAYGESVYVNGVVYWLSTYKYFDSPRTATVKSIIAFDVGREKFRVIPIPEFIVDCRQSGSSQNQNDLLEIDGCLGLLDRKLIVDGEDRKAIKMWIFHDNRKGKNNVSSNWTEETIAIPLEWELKHTWIRRSELLFQAITGTDLIIMRPERYKQSGGVFSLYCYDRKNKTMNLVEVSTVSNSKGFRVNESVCGTLVESLYPVHSNTKVEELQNEQIA